MRRVFLDSVYFFKHEGVIFLEDLHEFLQSQVAIFLLLFTSRLALFEERDPALQVYLLGSCYWLHSGGRRGWLAVARG